MGIGSWGDDDCRRVVTLGPKGIKFVFIDCRSALHARQFRRLMRRARIAGLLAPVLVASRLLAQSGDTTQASQKRPGFLSRLAQAYADDYAGKAPPAGSIEKSRILPAPLDAPPFPSADWVFGGAPDIGSPTGDATTPLMRAIYGGGNGDWWRRTGVDIYGWVNGGFNISTSHASNAPAAYYIRPNGAELDQVALYIERVPNTVQTDHVDWGFRVTNLYGLDYRFTTVKGVFSQQLLQQNNFYGYDPVMVYADVYIPFLAQGLNLRVGRYISLPDVEAQLAPDNYTYSHSLLYTYDAYTQTGLNATLLLSPHWMLQAGLSAGNDVVPGVADAQPTLNACVRWTSGSGNDNLYPCLNSLNHGKYAYNNVQSLYLTWYHKFSSVVHMDVESWYMWERDVPNVAGNVGNPPPTETNANGAYCDPGQRTCLAPEWAIVDYVEREFSPRDYLSIRNEYFDDERGQRTGYKTRYTEHLVGWGHWIGSTITIRPELRFERAYDRPAYDNGTKQNQLIVAADVILKY
jgi:hypothetical protein